MLGRRVMEMREEITEVRLRVGRAAELVSAERSLQEGEPMEEKAIRKIAAGMLEHSLYAWEEELCRGFFSLPGGCRVGVSGRYAARDGQMRELVHIQALCVRVPREIPGCAKEIAAAALQGPRPRGVLLVSRPGMGKTTCLRDLVRRVSEAGWHVGLVDERGELAAMRGATPTLNVGPRTDVMDACPKDQAIPRLVRSMSPDVIAVDELGSAGDGEAVLEAMRCGVTVMATAHASGFSQARRRACLGALMDAGAFPVRALLDGAPGRVADMRICQDGNDGEDGSP